ncbi:MAG: hypothetical protein SF172_09430 [Burkholderiales bacterium]|nr:hypothetical protein [Burkholderiales bacterium]
MIRIEENTPERLVLENRVLGASVLGFLFFLCWTPPWIVPAVQTIAQKVAPAWAERNGWIPEQHTVEVLICTVVFLFGAYVLWVMLTTLLFSFARTLTFDLPRARLTLVTRGLLRRRLTEVPLQEVRISLETAVSDGEESCTLSVTIPRATGSDRRVEVWNSPGAIMDSFSPPQRDALAVFIARTQGPPPLPLDAAPQTA